MVDLASGTVIFHVHVVLCVCLFVCLTVVTVTVVCGCSELSQRSSSRIF